MTGTRFPNVTVLHVPVQDWLPPGPGLPASSSVQTDASKMASVSISYFRGTLDSASLGMSELQPDVPVMTGLTICR